MNPDPHATWKDANGDETYALDWDIDASSRVWEMGGIEGRWAAQILAKFDPHLEIFEPQSWACKKMQERFRDFEKVDIYPFGLWVADCYLPLYNVGTDGASLVHAGARSEVYEFRDIYNQVFSEIDLCLMNVEGAEYALLPYMIGNNLMKNFRQFWCQFHPWLVGEGELRYKIISKALQKTHKKIWDFYPSAVAWERR